MYRELPEDSTIPKMLTNAVIVTSTHLGSAKTAGYKPVTIKAIGKMVVL